MPNYSGNQVHHWYKQPIDLEGHARSFPSNWHSKTPNRIYPTPQVRHKFDDETSRFIIRTLGFIYRKSRFVTKNYLPSTERDVSYMERHVLYMANPIVEWPPQSISLKSLNNRGPPKVYIAFEALTGIAKKGQKGHPKAPATNDL